MSINLSNIQSPGVYINEVNGFPNSVVPVATAVPVFIGYTPQASYNGQSYTNVPTPISSFDQFLAIFCLPSPPPPANPVKQYSPQYYLVPQKAEPTKGDSLLIDNTYYSILPDPNTIYYLYNSVQLFFQNGGANCYIISVGGYGAPSGKPTNPGDLVVNLNVRLNDLLKGLDLLLNEPTPTMYICPEATLLSIADNTTLMQKMLRTCGKTQTAVCIFDIIGGAAPDANTYTQDIQNFRNATGSQFLNYGAAYYPYVETTIMQTTDIDYTNFFGSDVAQLATIINPPAVANTVVTNTFNQIISPGQTPLTVAHNNTALISLCPDYANLIKLVLSDLNTLPPSGAMAGVITTMDNQGGPWLAPANTSIVGVVGLPINLSTTQQADLNVDVSGKSINAIRSFNGMGILVWGARTLDGNSLDWRYLPVRRTVTFIEQSCKLAAQAYVFQPNDKNTWEAVIAMINSILTNVWKQGGLMGSSASDAFQVACGLGVTMTGDDILNGFMNVTVKVAVVRPAEFIVITFQQQQATSS